MKEFQFTTDAYRFHAALNRLCGSPNTWYNSGPSQKFILRQIKAMDYSLVSEGQRVKHFAEKASYTARDSEGHLVVNDDMDVALLTLYGHMLYAGANYAFALSMWKYQTEPTGRAISMLIYLQQPISFEHMLLTLRMPYSISFSVYAISIMLSSANLPTVIISSRKVLPFYSLTTSPEYNLQIQ